MSNVVDLSKFASKNENDKWITQILGLPDEARHKFSHADLVQLLGCELIQQRILIESVRNALEKVAHGLIEIPDDTTIPTYSMDLVNTIDQFPTLNPATTHQEEGNPA